MRPQRPVRPSKIKKRVVSAAPASDPTNLPDFDQFVGEMKQHLTLVPEKDLSPLLMYLYEAAKAKLEFEDYRRWAQAMATRYRRMRNSMEVAGKALSKAVDTLEKAKADDKDLEFIEWIQKGYKFNFEEITRQVKVALETVEDSKAALAAMIHPHLRSTPEKHSAKKLSDPNFDTSSLEDLVFPARTTSPEIDHWFMGAAAECLDKYRTGTDKKIPRYDKIIYELFKVAFRQTKRDVDSIRREVNRQMRSGRPAYQIPGRPVAGAIESSFEAAQPATPAQSIDEDVE